MKCRKCGAELLDTDTFCVKCGQRVDQPMFCASCGEQLRDGERFCHNCGTPVELVPEDDEIPLSKQRTVDIPFDQIEQAILMEAEQAVVKRPEKGRLERRNPEDYSRPGAEEKTERRQPSVRDKDLYGQLPVREPAYDEDFEDVEEERYEMRRPKRHTPPPRPRYEEEYDYEDEEDEDDDSDDSKMKILTIILGIVVVAIALAIGFVFWQRNRTPDYGEPGETTEQGQETDGEEEGGEGGELSSADTKGRIQILSNVNVRNKPTTEGSEVMMVAKTGDTYEYYELVDGAWYHIKLEDGRDGYVSKKYVEDLK